MQPDEKKNLDDDFLKPEEPVPGTEHLQDFAEDKPIEQVDSFDSLIDIGMIDHKPTETFSDIPVPGTEQPIEAEPITPEPIVPEPPTPLETIREYSENSFAQSAAIETEISYPFHFYAEGKFGFYERDKLLRFITENPVGMTSAEIDLQINSGRVLIPRISEYAGIKLIQELRDSPLKFKLTPSSREGDELREQQPPMHIQYDAQNADKQKSYSDILVIDPTSPDRSAYQEFDQIQATQYLKAEIVEAEKSELFQELVNRMIESVKKKAQLKGADAITKPQTQVLTLRLPSQYQVVLSTSLLKKSGPPFG